jgi:hypothetical protein
MFPKILVLQNLLKFTFLPSQIFYNFLEIFGIFPNYFCHPNFLIHFPKSRNQFLMDFPFLFFSSPVGPPTPFALAHRMTQAAQPTTPAHLLHSLLGPSGPRPHLLPPTEAGHHHHRHQACAAATPKPPWPAFPSCTRHAPLLHHPSTLFPL